MPETNRKVAVKIAQGMEITEATKEDEVDSSMAAACRCLIMMAGADEDYNTRYGSTHGWEEAFRRVKPIPRRTAQLNFTQMVTKAKLETTTDVVDYFVARLLRVPLSQDDRQAMIDFLTKELGTDRINASASYLEEPVRLLVHSIMSTPEYQLG